VSFRGSRGDTQGKSDGAAREILTDVLLVSGQLMDIRKRSFIRFVRESELPIVPLGFQGQQNLERGKGQYLHHVSEEVKEKRLQKCYWWRLYQKAKQENL
jgi:hypothetical protein